MKQPAIYILANKPYGTLYTGVTSNLAQRITTHKHNNSFTKRYDCTHLVYYELFATMPDAIAREKQIKAGPRKRKVALIENMNSEWRDLFEHYQWL